MFHKQALLTMALTASLLSSCASTASTTTWPPITSAQAIQLPGYAKDRIFRDGEISFAGQPTEQAIIDAAQAGIKTIINLRSTPEVENLGWAESDVATGRGIEYLHIPVTPNSFCANDVARLAAVFEAGPKRTLIHCASSNRVGAMWAAYLILHRGYELEDALTIGKAAGLQSQSMIAAVRRVVGEKYSPRGVTTWGTMREVLREGKSEGRVDLANIATPHTIGVGALEGLAGEVTIVDGRVLVATTAIGNGGADGTSMVRDATDTDRAALLVLADVLKWDEFELGTCASYEELERAIATHLRQRGADMAKPTPVRVRGIAQQVDFHVIAGSCPIANPAGTPPWRHRCESEAVELIGFYVEGAAGRLTHHTHSSHLHVVAGDLMGHVDAVSLQNAVLLLPSK